MMLLGVKLVGKTQLGKGPGDAPGPASHWVLRAKGRLTYLTVCCHTSLRKRGSVRQEEGVRHWGQDDGVWGSPCPCAGQTSGHLTMA